LPTDAHSSEHLQVSEVVAVRDDCAVEVTPQDLVGAVVVKSPIASIDQALSIAVVFPSIRTRPSACR
jgi:hypothetical protein